MEGTNVFDLLIGLCGAYLIYAAISMKVTGNIIAGVMFGKGEDVSSIKDKQGFINNMFGKVLVTGIVVCIGGVVGLLEEMWNLPYYVTLIATACYLIMLVWFVIASQKAKKKYM